MVSRNVLVLIVLAGSLMSSAFCAELRAQDKKDAKKADAKKTESKEKNDYKITIYDDEFLKGKRVVIRGAVPDLNTLKFNDHSESIAWSLPPGVAAVLCDDKNFQHPVLILVGSGKVEDLGKEQPNALHSISSVTYVKFPKVGKPTGPLKDVPLVGSEDE